MPELSLCPLHRTTILETMVKETSRYLRKCYFAHIFFLDGKNLSAPAQFRSKEISKSNVVDDMVASNKILYHEEEHPDHLVVIK